MTRRLLSRQSRHGGSSTGSSRSDASDNTHSTAPSIYSGTSLLKYSHDRPGIYYGQLARVEEPLDYEDFGGSRASSGSVNTYASTTPSEADRQHQPEFEVPLAEYDIYPSEGIPSTPANFAHLFPSDRRLLIHHDDATSDGNMNLRVDTEVSDSDGRPRKLILFHLRMMDLRDRRFSLRRYCRESGREVCNSTRKDARTSPVPSARSASPTDTVQLEFSNYAHVNVNKRGSKRSKRYELEYWGTKYEWKRQVYRDGHSEEVSYHLINDKTSKSIAHITPEPLTAREAQEEEDFGGWVPPCSMRITDTSVFRSLTDVAE